MYCDNYSCICYYRKELLLLGKYLLHYIIHDDRTNHVNKCLAKEVQSNLRSGETHLSL